MNETDRTVPTDAASPRTLDPPAPGRYARQSVIETPVIETLVIDTVAADAVSEAWSTNVTVVFLVYEDIARARAFFLDALGFEDVGEVRDDAGDLRRSHVRFGDTVLLLDTPGAHDVRSPRTAGGVTHLVVINVGDVDAHHARAAGTGATILQPPTDRPWGRDYEILDAEGYRFSFIP